MRTQLPSLSLPPLSPPPLSPPPSTRPCACPPHPGSSSPEPEPAPSLQRPQRPCLDSSSSFHNSIAFLSQSGEAGRNPCLLGQRHLAPALLDRRPLLLTPDMLTSGVRVRTGLQSMALNTRAHCRAGETLGGYGPSSAQLDAIPQALPLISNNGEEEELFNKPGWENGLSWKNMGAYLRSNSIRNSSCLSC